MNKFKPNMYKKSIFAINYDLLKKKNIKLLAIDLDNTIVPYNMDIPNKETFELINKLKNDFIIVITSNNIKKRVKKVSDYLKCDYFSNLLKPSKKLMKLIKNKYNINMNEVSVIGDQLVTDIFVGNRINAFTILVDPLVDKDMIVTFFNRLLEKNIMKRNGFIKGNYYE